ncbi:MAG: 2-hydroxychromene-2-carboxylate isomerase [Panacagrimonas sp.]
MMPVEFHFDFGSPNAYLAHKVLPDVAERTGVPITYVPVLLGGIFKATGNRSPIEAFAAIRNKPQYEQLEIERFVRRHHIAFQWNPHFPVNTLTLMRGAMAAQELKVFERYVEVIFHNLWVEQKKLDDEKQLRAVLEASGLNAHKLLLLTQEPYIKERLAENTRRSVERGTFGAPSFFVGEELYFGKDRLRDVEEAIGTVATETHEEPAE